MREDIKILFEDNHILVVSKPPFMPVQADVSGDEDLLSALKRYLVEKYNKPGDAYLGLVHRLDRPTGGVMVFARNSKSAKRLCDQIQSGEFEKTYFAIVKGKPIHLKDHLVNYIKKDLKLNKASIVTMSEKDAKKAVLDYEMLQSTGEFSLLKISLETGRSHQIRLQLDDCVQIGRAHV